ncbi:MULTISPECIES: hypothetical protein [Brevibacillus]|uniref:hypothetical protein n=1 Tax=Brevibacillus TaxID=55080 RepID=UPI002E1E51A8|nr:hypothetical protein [Brevibacillus borstelensis]
MDVQADQKPIYDERANAILRGLVEGKTRDELAKELGYKNYKTLDIYMRRKNFKWDRDKQNYVPAYSRVDKQDMDLALLRSSKVATVISLFQKEGADAKTIAKRLGFADHRELANYMRAKGYRWSSEQGNYTRVYGQLQEEAEGRPEAVEELQDSHGGDEAVNTSTAPRLSRADTAQLERYLPLLEMLERNKDRLIDLIVPGAESGKVPRYAVPGIFVTKSVHMTNTLDSLVREYSKEKNISQRDIFAVALIEFFRRYGYEREIETLLGRT